MHRLRLNSYYFLVLEILFKSLRTYFTGELSFSISTAFVRSKWNVSCLFLSIVTSQYLSEIIGIKHICQQTRNGPQKSWSFLSVHSITKKMVCMPQNCPPLVLPFTAWLGFHPGVRMNPKNFLLTFNMCSWITNATPLSLFRLIWQVFPVHV